MAFKQITMHHYRFAILAFMAACVTAGCNKPELRGAVPSDAAAMELRAEAVKAGGEQDASSAGSASAQERTGWATLRGTIKVVGDLPQRRTLTISKDTSVCAPGGKPVLSQAVVVDPKTKGLANVAFYALDVASDNVHDDAKTMATEPMLFDQKSCVFLSHVLPMLATQTLKIKNSDSVPHNTKIDGKRSKFSNLSLPPGASANYIPGKAEKEPISVSCSIHPWMSAYLLPRDDAYAVVTGKDGSFEIKNLPAGVDLSIQVWHEKLGKNFQGVQVNGKSPNWKRGRMAIRLEPDDEQILEITIPASAL